MSLKNIPINWCVSTIGDINDYKSLTFNPKSHQEGEFELYSVPSFASGSPEVLLGKDIASNKQYIQDVYKRQSLTVQRCVCITIQKALKPL